MAHVRTTSILLSRPPSRLDFPSEKREEKGEGAGREEARDAGAHGEEKEGHALYGRQVEPGVELVAGVAHEAHRQDKESEQGVGDAPVVVLG